MARDLHVALSRNPDVLKQLASATGGESFLPDNVKQASQTLERIAQDIRSVYALGYVPTNANRDGRYRKIRVTLSGERQREPLRVRAREGYIAPLDGT